ncbi:MAG: energy transducer TonB [Rhizomicrobium sp.]
MSDPNLAAPPRFSLRARLIGAAALMLSGIAIGVYLEYGIVMGQLAAPCPPVWPRVPPVLGDARQGIVAPHVVDHPLDYSWGEQLVGMHGDVLVEVFVEPDGGVGAARLIHSSGYCPLDASALAGIARWRYSPAARHGVPFGAWWITNVAFRLGAPRASPPASAGQQTMNSPLHR